MLLTLFVYWPGFLQEPLIRNIFNLAELCLSQVKRVFKGTVSLDKSSILVIEGLL